MTLRLSVLDYANIDPGADAVTAVTHMDRLAETADRLGFEEYWLSEHHGYDSSVSVAPEILMARIASRTARIRVGSGGVMLPNYASYKVAETFRTIEAFAPGRVSLGVGRSTGADREVTMALNDEKTSSLPYDRKLADLLGFLGGAHAEGSPYEGLVARPLGGGLPTPWVLGGSGSTAALAARHGIGFTFAHFINPGDRGPEATAQYRRDFRPSAFLERPEVLVGVFVAIGSTATEAEDLGRALHLWLAFNETRDPNASLPSIDEARATRITRREEQVIAKNAGRVLVGTADQVLAGLEDLGRRYGTDHLLVNPYVPGVEHRIRALESLADAAGLRA